MRSKWSLYRGILPVIFSVFLLFILVFYLRQPRASTGEAVVVRPSTEAREAAVKAVVADQGDTTTTTSSKHVHRTHVLPQVGLPGQRRPPLTVVCVSDTHGIFDEEGLVKVPKGDMLLFPGDIAVGTPAEGLRFSRWLEGLPVSGPRVITWGNMDTATPGLKDPIPGAIVLVNKIQEVNGYRIFASPWTPRFAGVYQLDMDEAESATFWSQLLPPDSDVDIILTHGPPYGIADKTGGKNRGDKGLLKAVQALEKPPLLWVCGHIHEQYGEHRVPHPRAPGGSILLLNSAVFYVQQAAHAESAQPRAVRLPEAVVVPR